MAGAVTRGSGGRLIAALMAAAAWAGGATGAQAAPQDVGARVTAPGPPTTGDSTRVAGGEPGSELRVWLVTAGPGDAVWERYGHNAIRVLDTRTGRDVAYNWGIFDFQQVDFIPRFLQGRMLYMMAPFQTDAMIDAYGRADREIVLQELDLTPAQKVALRDVADRNAQPEHRDYFYQYFRDNCSTRVRDVLDMALGGQLREHFEDEPTGTSYRDHTRRLMQVDPLIYTGMDLLLGTPTDQPISVWEEMFLPMTLRDELRDATITGPDGVERPLVISEEVVIPSTRAPEPAEAPSWFLAYLCLGMALGAILASRGTARVRASTALRRTVVGLTTLWCLVGGVLGTILVLLLFTDHTFAYWNENLFLFNPLLLVLGLLVPLSHRGGRWAARARTVAFAIAALAIVGLLWQVAPASVQQNAIFFALALPAHLGAAWALRSTPPHDESTA